MTRTGMFIWVLMALMAVTAVPAVAAPDGPEQAPPRYPVAITDEAELLRVFAAGLVGDAFGYDANEVLYHVRAAGMPTEDIVPTFHAAFLAGRNFMDVVERRAGGEAWGVIVHDLGIDAATLNSMGVPSAVEFTDPRVVPDEVYTDMFVCGALARAFGINPDDVFLFYEAGWSALDVLAAVHIGYRTNKPFSAYLTGSARRLDWYEQARRAGVSPGEVARTAGRCYDNMMPAMLDEPLRPDLELMYAEELAQERWAVPVSTVRRARYTYLYCPSELLISFHLADLGPYPYYRVGRLYAWEHRRLWGPTIVVLGIPASHFRTLPVWVGGRVDFYAVQPISLHYALLSSVLVWRTPLAVDFYYTRFDPWFRPPDAIVYYGVYRRHQVPFSDYYTWRQTGRPLHSYKYVGRDLGDFRRSVDWVGNRRVGAVVGHKTQVYGVPDPAWATGGKARYGAPPGRPTATPSPRGLVVGHKTYDERKGGPGRQPGPVASPTGPRPGTPGGRPTTTAPQPRTPDVTGPRTPKPGERTAPRTGPGVTINAPGTPGGRPTTTAPQPRTPDVTGPRTPKPDERTAPRTGPGVTINAPGTPGGRPTTTAPQPRTPDVTGPRTPKPGERTAPRSGPGVTINAPGTPGGRPTTTAPQPRMPDVTGPRTPKPDERTAPRTGPGVTINAPGTPGGRPTTTTPQPRTPEWTVPSAPVSGYRPSKPSTTGPVTLTPAPSRPAPEPSARSRSTSLGDLWRRFTAPTTQAPSAPSFGPVARPSRPSSTEVISPGGPRPTTGVATPQAGTSQTPRPAKGEGRRKR